MDRPESIGEKMLRPPLREVLIKRKRVLERILIWYANRLPEMVREDTDEHNTRALFDIRDRFLSHMRKSQSRVLCEAIFKIAISEYKHDPNWQQWADWLKEELDKTDWKKLPEGQPSGGWTE